MIRLICGTRVPVFYDGTKFWSKFSFLNKIGKDWVYFFLMNGENYQVVNTAWRWTIQMYSLVFLGKALVEHSHSYWVSKFQVYLSTEKRYILEKHCCGQAFNMMCLSTEKCYILEYCWCGYSANFSGVLINIKTLYSRIVLLWTVCHHDILVHPLISCSLKFDHHIDRVTHFSQH